MPPQQFYRPDRRPSRDDGMYDDESQLGLPGNQPSSPGVSRDDTKGVLDNIDSALADNDEAYKSFTGDELNSGEKAADQGAETLGGEAAANESDLLGGITDQLGKGYAGGETGITKMNGRFWTRQKTIGGGIAGILVGGGIGLSVFFAPTLIINNLREIIINQVSQVQVHHSRKYRRSRITKFTDLFSKEGRIGGKMITDMEAHGYKFSYVDKKVVGLTLPNGEQSLRLNAIGDHIEDYMEVRHPLHTSRWKTKRMNALYSRFGISRTSIISTVDETVDNPEKLVNQRIAKNVLSEPFELSAKPADPVEGETNEQRAARESSNAAADQASKPSGVMGEVREELLDGEDVDIATKNAGIEAGEDALGQLGSGVGKAALDIAGGKSVVGKLAGGLKSFFSPTDTWDKVCTIKRRLRMSSMVARNYRALALFRYTATFIGVADGIRQGKGADPRLINAVMKRVNSLDRNGNPIGASPGFAYAVKKKFSRSQNNATKGSYGVDGQLTGAWAAIQDGTDNIPGTSRGQCAVVQNPIVQVGSGIVLALGKVFSGGSSAVAEGGASVAATTTIKASIQSAIRSALTKKAVQSVALGLAAELTFEGIMTLMQLYIEKSLTLPVTGQETGAELGSILTAGGGVANKQRSLQAGMVPATTSEYQNAANEFVAWEKEESSKQNLFAKVFDTNNPSSLAFKVVASAPLGFSGMASFISVNLAERVSSLFSGQLISDTFANIFSNKAFADDEISFDQYVLEKGPSAGQSIATDFAGNPQVIMRPDIEAIDPEENVTFLSNSGDIDPATLEAKSDMFKNHITNCVDTIDILSQIEFNNDPTNPEKDCLAQNPLTVRFKAHLAFLDMIDGISAEFSPEDL